MRISDNKKEMELLLLRSVSSSSSSSSSIDTYEPSKTGPTSTSTTNGSQYNEEEDEDGTVTTTNSPTTSIRGGVSTTTSSLPSSLSIRSDDGLDETEPAATTWTYKYYTEPTPINVLRSAFPHLPDDWIIVQRLRFLSLNSWVHKRLDLPPCCSHRSTYMWSYRLSRLYTPLTLWVLVMFTLLIMTNERTNKHNIDKSHELKIVIHTIAAVRYQQK